MRHSSVVLALCGALIGCGGQSTRTVTGQLQVNTSSMKAPAVVAQSADRHTFAATPSSGRFTLQLPTGARYRLSLATTKTSGAYTMVSDIKWPFASGPAIWARLGSGDTLDLDHEIGDGDHVEKDEGDHDDDSCDGGAHHGGGGSGGGGGGGGGLIP